MTKFIVIVKTNHEKKLSVFLTMSTHQTEYELMVIQLGEPISLITK